MSERKIRILVADDEPKYVRIIRVVLEAKGYEVTATGDGQTAVEVAASEEPDLIILDIKMPRLDGFAACQRIREFSTTPIIMVTALADDTDKIKGLEVGADDYVTKPFNANELLARVQSTLRRMEYSKIQGDSPVFRAGDLNIDFSKQRVFVAGKEVLLTPIEYRLLSELASNAGRVLVIDRLLDTVWGSECAGEERLVWRAIHRLRLKIEPDPKKPLYIQNRPGIGYVFDRRLNTSGGS